MRTLASVLASSLLLAGTARADMITVTIENLLPAGGLSFTPVWLGFHDGGFTNFAAGAPASDYDGIEAIAELGAGAAQMARFAASQPLGVQTMVADLNGAPVFSPGESRSVDITLDAVKNAFFSFASMLVPTNDLFLGDPGAIQLFDGGSFVGPITIDIHGSMVWDAGTESNSVLDGGAFVMGVDATRGTVEGGVIHLFLGDPGAPDYLSSLLGLTTADGGTISSTFGDETLIGRITIVPAPGAAMLAILSLARSRRR
ncbi:MAG: hypothetical protein FJ253_07165 [Phycisphaerae bacterium]|nr:hypothetical protein [Phycisphaerae bacterium]